MSDELRLARIEKKIDIILAHASKVDSTLGIQAAQLAEHMRRTAAAEAAIKTIERNHMKYAIGVIGAMGAIIFELWVKRT